MAEHKIILRLYVNHQPLCNLNNTQQKKGINNLYIDRPWQITKNPFKNKNHTLTDNQKYRRQI